ncbi:hypothetical protein CK203_061073 [Vitis vinifera]|uniref:Uncharacterized protein n=1 Tax=Vitis vinifera TaxID=29760 RepID=A0A438G9Y5_VITVI|nr:hypothetical protein CK203_061073 [Vitis vinifera]
MGVEKMKHTGIPPKCQGHNSLGKRCEAKINDVTMLLPNSSLLLMGVGTRVSKKNTKIFKNRLIRINFLLAGLLDPFLRQCLDMLYGVLPHQRFGAHFMREFKVVNLLHMWMLMALVLTMLPRRTPSTLVITEAMAIIADDLVVREV